MRLTTDADYDKASRHIIMHLAIYFDPVTPTQVTVDDYLIEATLTEDLGMSSDSIEQSLVANTLYFNLYNKNNLFNPTNVDSEYAAAIKRGLKIVVDMGPSDDTITPDGLGVYYMTDWIVDSAGKTVNVTASDKAYDLINDQDPPALPVVESDAGAFLQLMLPDISLSLDCTLGNIPYLYTLATRATTLNRITNADSVVATVLRDDTLHVFNLAAQTLQHTLTDADQIISCNPVQSANLQYEDASVTYYLPSFEYAQNIVSILGTKLTAGVNTFSDLEASIYPIKSIDSAMAGGKSNSPMGIVAASSQRITFMINNTGSAEVVCDIQVYGTTIKFTSASIPGVGNSLAIDNQFIQTKALAQTYQQKAKTFVSCHVPIVEVEIHGNPGLKLGDKVRVYSYSTGVDIKGYIIKNSISYAGALSEKITVLNAEALGVTT